MLTKPIDRTYFRLVGSQPRHRRRIAEALYVIDSHADYAVSVSWGKDSIVALSLAAERHPSIVAIHGRYHHAAERLSDLDAVRDVVLGRYPGVRYIEVPVPGEWDVFERVGHAFRVAESAEERAAIGWWDRAFASALRDAAVGAGCRGFIYGYRGRESRARTINIRVRGIDYLRADGMGSALPLAYWTSDDVWARLVARDLAWPRIYDLATDRERMRSDFTWTVNRLTYGQEAEWRWAYPDLFAEWLERWPELRATTS